MQSTEKKKAISIAPNVIKILMEKIKCSLEYYSTFKETFKENFSHHDFDIVAALKNERNQFMPGKTYEIMFKKIDQTQTLQNILDSYAKDRWHPAGILGLMYFWNTTKYVGDNNIPLLSPPVGAYVSPMSTGDRLPRIRKAMKGLHTELMFFLSQVQTPGEEKLYDDDYIVLFREELGW